MYLLGIIDHFKCDNDNFKCIVDENSLINVDGSVFEIVNKQSYGFYVNQRILPSRILPFEEGGNNFCKIIKTNDDVFHAVVNKTVIYSEYYGIEAGVPGMWTDTDGNVKNGGADFYKEAVNPVAAGGSPIVAVRVDEVLPIPGKHRDQYHFFRHAYLSQKECTINDIGTVNYIDPDALKGTGFMLIKNKEGYYLHCQVEGTDDNTRGCGWQATATMMWGVGVFDVSFRGTLNSNEYGFNHVLIGYDMSGNEIGWMDRSKCHSDTDDGDATRLLVDGKKDGQGLHCGASNWKFYRDDPIRAGPSANMGGTSGLCHNQDKAAEFGNDHVTSCLGVVADNTAAAAACSLVISSITHTKHMCDGNHGIKDAGDITIEQKFLGMGKLYKVTSMDKSMVCSQYGDRRCIWVPSDGATRQVIKFNNNFIMPSSSVLDLTKFGNARQTATVYELINGFWTSIGQLELNSNDNTLMISNSKTSDSILGWVKTLNDRIYKHGDNVAIARYSATTTDNFVHVNSDGSDLVLTEERDFVVDTENYTWVTDGSGQCPNGYYLHQVRCTTNQKCEFQHVGCVKATDGSCQLNTTAPITYVDIKHDQFVSCPRGHVVVGRTPESITCLPIIITPTAAVEYVYPQTPTLGFLVKNNHKSTSVVINEANWVGTPIQGINPQDNGIVEWHYGRSCYVDYEYSRSAVAGATFPSINIPDKTVACGHNEFIVQTRCLTNDCRNGMEVRCETAPHCLVNDESPTIVTSSSTEQPICPFGQVMTQITCKSIGTEGTQLIPCERVEIKCQTVVFDSNYNPTKPPSPDSGDSKNSLKIIIISLGVGLPLIVLSAIACLCCIPDNDDSVETERSNSRITITDAEMVGSDYEGIRRRRTRIMY